MQQGADVKASRLPTSLDLPRRDPDVTTSVTQSTCAESSLCTSAKRSRRLLFVVRLECPIRSLLDPIRLTLAMPLSPSQRKKEVTIQAM